MGSVLPGTVDRPRSRYGCCIAEKHAFFALPGMTHDFHSRFIFCGFN
jgi:hypothetical protein